MTEEQAIAEVKLYAQTDAFPSLTTDQVTEIVRKNMRASVWTANKQYKIGNRVQPTVPNRHFYKCIEIGTSAANEPVWTTRFADTNRDDATLVWEECGDDLDGNLYNTRDAIHSAWLVKASMVANQFDMKIDDQTLNRSQIYDNCMKMARSFSPVEF